MAPTVRSVLALTTLVLGGIGGCEADPPTSEPTPEASPAPTIDAAAELGRANEAEAKGDLAGALAHAEAAAAAGGGRDAVITVAKLAILLEQYDKAVGVLQPWVAEHATDAIAQYDLGLAHQHRNDYNRARSAYIATVRADPGHAEARYNLAVLCWRKGFADEAIHHVDEFRKAHPDDPRNADLLRLIRPAAKPATPDTSAAAPHPPATPGP